MAIERINPSDVYEPNRNIYTQVVRAIGAVQVHVAGTVPFDLARKVVGLGDMAAQTRAVLDNIDKSLAAGGATRADVVRINVFVTDVDRYIAEGAPQVVAYFGETKPASTTVEVSRLVHPDWLVEIEATAVTD